MNRCLYCYKEFVADEMDFHPSCSKKIFGHPTPPLLPISENEFESLAAQLIQVQSSVTGVQTKLSLHITNENLKRSIPRFTVVGLMGGYILKPQSHSYPQLPEVEDLTMHLAEAAKIKTVPHSLIRIQSGELAYITQRCDRTKKGKLAMEDMCQLTERLTEEKYHGSYEQIGKAILKYSVTPGLDLVNFFEIVIFSFLTGNADMHLKNFSLLEQPGLGMTLAPAYDFVNTALVNPDDKEEMALTLNGRKNKLKKQDFVAAMNALRLDTKQQENIFYKWPRIIPQWHELIDRSFVSDIFKEQYKSIVRERLNRLV